MNIIFHKSYIIDYKNETNSSFLSVLVPEHNNPLNICCTSILYKVFGCSEEIRHQVAEEFSYKTESELARM